MNIADWKNNEVLVAWAAKTFSNKEGREFINMLEDSHPRLSVLQIDASDGAKVSKLGMNDGYQIALNIMESATKLKPPGLDIEPDFGAIK